MNEDEAAEIERLHETKDDPAEWGDAIPATSGRRLDAVVSVRFSPSELEIVKQAAGNRGVSKFIREAAVKEALGVQPRGFHPKARPLTCNLVGPTRYSFSNTALNSSTGVEIEIFANDSQGAHY